MALVRNKQEAGTHHHQTVEEEPLVIIAEEEVMEDSLTGVVAGEEKVEERTP